MQSPQSLRYIIALPLLPEIGLRTARLLIEELGSAEAVFQASEEELLGLPNARKEHVRLLINGRKSALERADKELLFIEKNKIQTYYFQDTDYPYRLRECVDAPLLLYGKGNLQVNEGKFLSVVGTRMPTDRGKQLCTEIVTELAQQVENLTIVSGLAYGIDVTAHKAAIAAGIPTLIIPGHGLDRIYPAVHRQVAVNSLENGGILTEYLSGTQPDRQNFVARNRIIAGLSDATLVVESKSKGGSLITAEMANGYNREVFTIPGRPQDTASAGCNALIKNQQAALVESAEDIIKAMQWESGQPQGEVQTELFTDLTPIEQQLLQMLREAPDGLHVNMLVMETQLPYNQITSTLMMMEMHGIVRSLPGSIFRAAK